MTNSSPNPRRDPLAERILLDRSQRLARLAVASWPSTVERRLETAQAEFGDSWARRSTAELLNEVNEETVDTAAWACLAMQSLVGVDSETTAAVGEMIARAIGAAAEAHAYVVAAQAALRKVRQ